MMAKTEVVKKGGKAVPKRKIVEQVECLFELHRLQGVILSQLLKEVK